MYPPVVGSPAPLEPVCQPTVVCFSSGSASWPVVAGRCQCRVRAQRRDGVAQRSAGGSRCSCMRGLSDLEGRVVVPAVQSAGSGSSHTAAYSASSSLSPEASARASLTPSGLAASSPASASSRIVSGSRPTSSAAVSLFGSSLIRSAAAYRRSSFPVVGWCAVVLRGDLDSLGPLLVCRVGDDGCDLLAGRSRIAIGHTVSSSCSCVSSRRVARIRPLRPMPGVLPERFPEAFDRGVELLADAQWFVMGGSRPARGAFGRVVSRWVGVFRSCSIAVVRVLRIRGHAVGISTIPTVFVADECPAGYPLRRRVVVRVPRAFQVVLLVSLKSGRWMLFGAVCRAGRFVGARRSTSSSLRRAWSRSWSLARFSDCVSSDTQN